MSIPDQNIYGSSNAIRREDESAAPEEKISFCPECGEEISDWETTCPRCGKKIRIHRTEVFLAEEKSEYGEPNYSAD